MYTPHRPAKLSSPVCLLWPKLNVYSTQDFSQTALTNGEQPKMWPRLAARMQAYATPGIKCVWSTTLHAGPATHYGHMGHLQGLLAVVPHALAVRTVPHIGLSGLNHMQKFYVAASHLDHHAFALA